MTLIWQILIIQISWRPNPQHNNPVIPITPLSITKFNQPWQRILEPPIISVQRPNSQTANQTIWTYTRPTARILNIICTYINNSYFSIIVWMRWCLGVYHMRLVWAVSCGYMPSVTYLHMYKAALMRHKRRNMRMYADGITLLHFGVVENSVCAEIVGVHSHYCKSSRHIYIHTYTCARLFTGPNNMS
jgi:hypothetical protein